MKTGILTFHETTNFGSLLQTYALYKVLKDKEVDCEIIDYECDEIIKREFKYERLNKKTIKSIIKYLLLGKKSQKKHNSLVLFLRENALIGNKYDKENIKDSNIIYDCFIVGSDIVWGLDVTGEDFTYLLDFVEDNKLKFSYASSANGIKGIKQEKLLLEELEKFDLIGVREKKVRDELWEYFPRYKVNLVCDPTMLIESGEWLNIAKKSLYNEKLKKEDYILMYFPDGEGKMLCDAKKLKKKYKYKIYHISERLPLIGVQNISLFKVEDFLCFILHAKIVLSGSYHGSLFSMYFNREFYYYVRAHGERMNTVSNILNVKDRKADYIDNEDVINYEEINKRIIEYREQSLEYVNEIVRYIK